MRSETERPGACLFAHAGNPRHEAHGLDQFFFSASTRCYQFARVFLLSFVETQCKMARMHHHRLFVLISTLLFACNAPLEMSPDANVQPDAMSAAADPWESAYATAWQCQGGDCIPATMPSSCIEVSAAHGRAALYEPDCAACTLGGTFAVEPSGVCGHITVPELPTTLILCEGIGPAAGGMYGRLPGEVGRAWVTDLTRVGHCL